MSASAPDVDRKRQCLHEELDDMMQGIFCITAASQTLLIS